MKQWQVTSRTDLGLPDAYPCFSSEHARDMEAMARGIVSAGHDPKTGEQRIPRLELVRLTIPRRVYTQAHMEVVAESVLKVHEGREQARCPIMTYEPKYLRFFQARFEPVAPAPGAAQAA
jgi:tryptophanase